MAFTNAQKVNIRRYLGFPNVLLDRNSRLESAMDLVGADADASAVVVALLASIAAVETELTGSLAAAGLKRAEDVEWYQSSSGGSGVIEEKRDEGRRYCNQLSILMGVPLVHDHFGQAGYHDDGWRGSGFQYGGGVIPLG